MRRRAAPKKAVAQKARVRTEPLTRLVTPIDSLAKSTNVERDMAGAGSLGTYIANASVQDTVHRLAESMKGGSRAFSVTGPYGSGKSTLAVFVGGLVAPSASADCKYAQRLLQSIAPETASALIAGRRSLGAHAGGFARCAVVAAREPITVTIVRALERGARDRFGARYSGRDFATAGQLRRLAAEMRRGSSPTTGVSHAGEIMEIVRGMCARVPVVVIVDEFGKSLEYAAEAESGDGDLFLLQSMAEAGSGDGALPLFVITMQHMAFEEYGARMSSAHRKEWAKVQGRFEDIPFSNSPGQTRLLVSRSLCAGSSTAGRKRVDAWAATHMESLRSLGLADELGEGLLASCYPLHPLSLLVLPELCARYGQYERTLVSFVAGGAAGAVPSFIDSARCSGDRLPSMDVEALYDYFVSSHQSAGSASAANVTRLMEITSIIRDSHGLTRHAVCALKTIGVLNLVSASGPLRASREVMRYVLGDNADAALEELEEKSIITHRAYADEYRVWRGTDVDIQAAIELRRGQYAEYALGHTLALVAPQEPMIAARHGIRTGTMRMFDQRFAGAAQDGDGAPGQDHDGTIIYLTERSAALPSIDSGSRPTIVVRPVGPMDELRRLALETAAIREMLETDDAVKGDWVARRELWDRMVHGITGTEAGLERAYGKGSEWWLVMPGSKPRLLDGTGGAAVSRAADIAYPRTPHVHNEMINRTKPSTQASRARLLLINAMIAHHGEEDLGIEGWGPERAMYESVMKRTGLHSRSSRAWGITEPRPALRAAWKSVMDSISRSRRHRVNVSEIYEALGAPPIGAKAGIMPVLLVAALITKRGDVALYEHGTYKPAMSPEVIERLIKNPGHFEVKHLASRTGARSQAIRRIARSLKVASPDASLLGVMGALARVASGLPRYTRATRSLAARDRRVRDAILEATEPDVMLFDALPKALGAEANSEKFARSLARSVRALERFYPEELGRLQSELLRATQTDERKRLATLAVSITERAPGADPVMRGFLNALATSTLDDAEWIGYVAMVLTNSPVTEWDDEARKIFDASLEELAGRFLRLVALNFDKSAQHLKSSPPPYRITVTKQDGSEDISVATAGTDMKEADRVVEEMIGIMDKRGMDRPGVIMALMASLSKKASRPETRGA